LPKIYKQAKLLNLLKYELTSDDWIIGFYNYRQHFVAQPLVRGKAYISHRKILRLWVIISVTRYLTTAIQTIQRYSGFTCVLFSVLDYTPEKYH